MTSRLRAALLSTLWLAGCGPRDTGGELVSFRAYASGVAGVNGAAEFDTGAGFHVQLTEARMHIGAVYMRLGKVGLFAASCVGDTTYGLQVPGSVDVNVLSSERQEFSVLGSATSDLNQSGEIWLVGKRSEEVGGTALVSADINQVENTAEVAFVAGVASRGELTFPFEGAISIGANRLIPATNPAAPGANPICKQRIVRPIPLEISPAAGGFLLLQIDPQAWLGGVDFSKLLPKGGAAGDGAVLEIQDASTGSGPDIASSRSFFKTVTSASPEVYQFSWLTE